MKREKLGRIGKEWEHDREKGDRWYRLLIFSEKRRATTCHQIAYKPEILQNADSDTVYNTVVLHWVLVTGVKG